MSQRATIYSWQQAICQSDLMPTTRLVLLTLGTFMNQHGESCYPSIETIADCSGLSKRAVITHLDKAETAGFLTVKSHGFRGQKWKRNEYSASFPDKKGGERPAPRHEKGGEPHSKGGEPNDTKAVNEVHQDKNNPVNNPRTTHSAGEGETEKLDRQAFNDLIRKIGAEAGSSNMTPMADPPAILRAAKRDGVTPLEILNASLAFYRDKAIKARDVDKKPRFQTVLQDGRYQPFIGQAVSETHEIEDLVAMTERQAREGMEAMRKKLEEREAA
jgi:hypothetical protein